MRCKSRGKDSLWTDRSVNPASQSPIIVFDNLERVAQNGYFSSAVPSIISLDQGFAREGGIVPVVVAQFRDLQNVAGHHSRLSRV